MVFKNLCVLVLRKKVASALEGFNLCNVCFLYKYCRRVGVLLVGDEKQDMNFDLGLEK